MTVIKMKNAKGQVYMKDLNGMRTNSLSEAMEMKSKSEGKKILDKLVQEGKCHPDMWEVTEPTKKKPMDAAIDKVDSDMKEQKKKEDAIKIDVK